MRFSLRWLFGIVAYVAIGCVSLIYASEPISKALGFALFAFLMIAVLGAVLAAHHRRRFWTGCAIVGLTYIGTSYLPQYHDGIRPPQSITKDVFDWVLQKLVRDAEDRATARGRIIRPDDLPQRGPLHSAGQSLVAFAWAIAGGIVAMRFQKVDERV